MKDPLENFVRQNREAFDDKAPSSRVWENIDSAMNRHSPSWLNPTGLWRAAAIFFMVLSGWLLLPEKQLKTENALALKEFSDVEAFYTQQISNKVELIDQFKRNDGVNGFTQDFQQLEAMYLVLREEMKARPSEQVKDALVLNLLVRIDLLNQHLQRLEDEMKPEKEQEKQERKT
jgi:hypothetical protein